MVKAMLLDDLSDWQEEVKAPIPREVNPEYEANGK